MWDHMVKAWVRGGRTGPTTEPKHEWIRVTCETRTTPGTRRVPTLHEDRAATGAL